MAVELSLLASESQEPAMHLSHLESTTGQSKGIQVAVLEALEALKASEQN